MITEIKTLILREGTPGKPLLSAREVASEFDAIRYEPQECFYVIHLDAKNRTISQELVSKGTATATLCHPRDIFRSAISRNAVSIIVIHNHPSGNTEPSTQDIKITRDIKAGDIIGIKVLDHLILGDTAYSMREAGYFEAE